MGFQGNWFGFPTLLLLLLLLDNSITLTDSGDNIHDFLGLNDPFFNPNIDSTFTAQEGGVAYLSCEATILIYSPTFTTTIFIYTPTFTTTIFIYTPTVTTTNLNLDTIFILISSFSLAHTVYHLGVQSE